MGATREGRKAAGGCGSGSPCRSLQPGLRQGRDLHESSVARPAEAASQGETPHDASLPCWPCCGYPDSPNSLGSTPCSACAPLDTSTCTAVHDQPGCRRPSSAQAPDRPSAPAAGRPRPPRGPCRPPGGRVDGEGHCAPQRGPQQPPARRLPPLRRRRRPTLERSPLLPAAASAGATTARETRL